MYFIKIQTYMSNNALNLFDSWTWNADQLDIFIGTIFLINKMGSLHGAYTVFYSQIQFNFFPGFGN